jgi:hypothetical protein
MPYIIRPRIRTLAVGLFAGALLTGAAPAVAAAACPAVPASQVFGPLGDSAFYALVPGGTFESGAPGWSLSQGEVISENVTLTHRQRALVIKPHGRVVSPPFCVTNEDPTFRFLYRTVRGGGKMNVGVSWTDGSGSSHETVVATLPSNPSWTASPVLPLASVLPLANVSTLEGVRLVFTATHPGLSFAIADVYIDPYRR